ncbi:MAG: SagB-type dehydrogenase family enzyme [Brevundimonas sp.]
MRYARQSSLVDTAWRLVLELRLAERWDRDAGSSFAQNVAAFNSDPEIIRHALGRAKQYETHEKTFLGPPSLTSPLQPVLGRRRSTPPTAQAVTLPQLETLLTDSFGVTRIDKTRVGDATIHKRTYPSPGALYPCEVYILVADVTGLEKGVYHYNPTSRSLSSIQREASLDMLLQPFFGLKNGFACAIVVSGILSRVIEKYALRAYRFMCLEAGHMGQNVCLSAAALNLSCTAWGAYYDAELNEIIGLDGRDESVLHTLLIGGPPEG